MGNSSSRGPQAHIPENDDQDFHHQQQPEDFIRKNQVFLELAPAIPHVPVFQAQDQPNQLQDQADLIKNRRLQEMKCFMISICLAYIIWDGLLLVLDQPIFLKYQTYFDSLNHSIFIILPALLMALYFTAHFSTRRLAQKFPIQIIIYFCLIYLTSLIWTCLLSLACNQSDSDSRQTLIVKLLVSLKLYRIFNVLIMLVIILYIACLKQKLSYSVMSLLLIPSFVSLYQSLFCFVPVVLLYIQILQLVSQLRRIQLQNEVKAFQSENDFTITQVVSCANQIYFNILVPWKYY